jgi:diguanylate cyclase (GGDEF)-like protein/PAS domain S-box-containing protein
MPTPTRNPMDPVLEPQVADAVIENASEGIVITDAAGNILRVNAAYCRVTGYRPEEVIGKNPRLIQSGRHDPSFYESMWNALLTEGRWSGKIWNRRKDGSIFLESLTAVALRDAEGRVTHYVGLFTDETYGGLDPAQISQLAFYDPLTGLAARPLLVDHLGEAIRHCKRKGCHAALLYLNLDDFGEVNKAHGHATGDALLKAYAEQLEASVRQNDTVARPGGDEFALILGELASPQDIPRVADKLLQRLAQPVEYEGRSMQLRASIGISIYPGHGQDPERLVGLAREAMTRAKAAGKDRWIVHEAQPDPNPAA